MQLIAFVLVAIVAAAAGFVLAAALASGGREDAYRAGYRAGMQSACLALSKITVTLDAPEAETEVGSLPAR
jgi:hypothetical protein